jgi:hypothetical protein
MATNGSALVSTPRGGVLFLFRGKYPVLNAKFGAGNEVRTRDLDLGKVALYQLSYTRLKMASPRGFEPLLPP